MILLLTSSFAITIFVILTLYAIFFKSFVYEFEIYISILAFLISILSQAIKRHERKRDRYSSVSDSFWFRVVIVPQLLKPLSKICEYSYEWNPSQIQPEVFLENFQIKKRRLVFKTSLCSVLDEDLPDRLIQNLDDFEDDLCNALFSVDDAGNYNHSVASSITKYNISYLRSLYRYHSSI